MSIKKIADAMNADGDDAMMFQCIKSAIVYFQNAYHTDTVHFHLDGTTYDISKEDDDTLTLSHGDIEITENDIVFDKDSDNGKLFRGVMVAGAQYFIPSGCGIVVLYGEKKYMVSNEGDDGVAVYPLDEGDQANVYDKFTIVLEDDPENPDQVSIKSSDISDLLANLQKPRYLN